MANRMDMMERLDAELHQFTRDHPKAVSDQYSESAYHYIKMQRICVLLSLLPMGAEKLNVLMDMDNHDTLKSILYYQHKNSRTDKRLAALPACVDSYVDELYKEYRRPSLINRMEKNCEDYKAGFEQLSPRMIIENAGAINARTDIVFHSGDMTGKLDLRDIEALLTLENPLEAIYQAWLKQEGRDMRNLDEIASQEADFRRGYLERRTGAPASGDEQLYRENHLNDPGALPMRHYMERLDDFWSVVDDEFNDLDLDVVDLDQNQAVYNYINSPHFAGVGLINLEALLTFNKPLEETIRLMDSCHYTPAVSLEMLAAQRLTDLTTYMGRIERLPNFLQEPARAFKTHFDQAQTIAFQMAAPAQEAAEQEDEELGEGR